MKKQKEVKSGDEVPSKQNGDKFSKDFRIALAKMIPSADFNSLGTTNQIITIMKLNT